MTGDVDTFLRASTHGHVQQFGAVGARLLAGLAMRVPDLLARGGADGVAFLDVDDTIRKVHGYAIQAAAYGYGRVRGLNIQIATVSTPDTAPMLARVGWRLHRCASGARK
ncbi:MAG: hypothetical protein WCF36_04450 [Candidatus Nanopelagicales bacterium]